ncbi:MULTISPECIES: hypothetical protein [Alphaproteobacteria]|uniref:hypothetical protein n=1 Tax=Alphaproteobacteria TaxID=28211 RepID=UPI00326352FC
MPRPRRRRAPEERATPAADEAFDRILIARVPASGGRRDHSHFNANVVRDYFRIADHQTQRVCLIHVGPRGEHDEVEVRQCVFSQTNRNQKFEIGAARGQDYREESPLVLVFRKRQLRAFDYMLLFPGDAGYGPLFDLSDRLPSLCRGFPRVATDMDTLERAWRDCSLLTSEDQDERDI